MQSKYSIRLISTLALCILVSSCFPAGSNGEAGNGLRSKSTLQFGDEIPALPIDLTLPAFIVEKPMGPEPEASKINCNSYCLRLLYAGISKSVIAGYANMPIFAPSSNSGTSNLELMLTCAQKDPEKTGRRCGLRIKKFTLERRSVCPIVDAEETYSFVQSFRRSEEGKFVGADQQAVGLAASGLCLIGHDVSIAEASIILFPKISVSSGGVDTIWTQHATLAYVFKASGELDEIYRHSVSYKSEDVMKWFNHPYCCTRTTSSDNRPLPAIMIEDLKLELPDLPNPTPDNNRTALAQGIGQNGPLTPSQKQLFKPYFEALKAKGTLDKTDIKILKAILNQPELHQARYELPSVMFALDDTKGVLTQTIIRLIFERVSRPNDSEEVLDNMSIYDYASLTSLLAYMPKADLLKNQASVVRVIKNGPLENPNYSISTLLAAIDPAAARPILREYLESSHDDFAEIAMSALCKSGEPARAMKDEMIAFYKAQDQTKINQNETYLSIFLMLKIDEEVLRQVPLGNVQRRTYEILKAYPDRQKC
jgi:hypothetical protein